MERAAFLARLRERSSAPQRVGRAHPLPVDPGTAAAAYPPGSEGLAGFTAAAERHGAVVRRLARGGALPGLVDEIVATHRVSSAVVSADPEVATLGALLSERDVGVLAWDGPGAASRADLGVTGAAYGIAATGSLVVDAARAGGRTASLLPPVHLALLSSERLLATPAGLWRRMAELFPQGLPSQLVVITGPSKTGDIEQVLATGVHGPKYLWIGIV